MWLNASRFIDVKSYYIIPLILFLGSFLIYSYNLEGQPWHGDEINYLGWAGNYIHLIKNGDFGNSCLISIDNCNLLFHVPAFGATYSPIRMLLIGLPMSVENQNRGDFFNWSCFWNKCYDAHKAPTIQQMAAGRQLSPFFGSLTIVILFLIGKILFNRYVGLIAALLFLFYDLWFWYSRSIMTEVHYIFFCMLSLLLLLYSFKTERPKIKYIILSAVTFGFALNSKLLAVDFSALFLGIILFGSLFKGQVSIISGKRRIPKISLLIFVFFSISLLSFVMTEPGFYKNPLYQIQLMKSDMDNYNRDVWFIGYPTVQGLDIVRVLSLFHYTLFPSFMQYHIDEPYFKISSDYNWSNPQTYSSIALTIFFLIGLGYSVKRVTKLKDDVSKALVLIWFVSTLILTLAIARDFSLERYLLPFLISMIVIASYGFWNFIKNIPYNKIKIAFAVYFVFAHSVTALYYWKVIYFSPGPMWFNPLPYGTLQESLYHPFTLVVNAIFVAFFLFMLIIRFRKRISVKQISNH